MAVEYRRAITNQVTNALKKTFDLDYAEVAYRGMYVGPEFQLVREKYPSIYTVYTERSLKRIGLGHFIEGIGEDGFDHVFHQWMFEGAITFNCLALSALERDTLADHLLDVVAFGKLSAANRSFHDEIYSGDYIILNLGTENVIPGGSNVLPVPWGAENENLFQCNYTLNCMGEFFSNPTTSELVAISKVNLYPYRQGQAIPQGTNDPAPWN